MAVCEAAVSIRHMCKCANPSYSQNDDVRSDRGPARTGLKPRDVGILVVNCSLFCPTPSLSAMLVNRFGMRSSILSYNLGGMGCSAGIIAIGLAEKLLQVRQLAPRGPPRPAWSWICLLTSVETMCNAEIAARYHLANAHA